MEDFVDREYKVSELNPAVVRFIREKEQYLDRKCRKIWSATNPKGERFLFGRFCKKYDRLIVTIAVFNTSVTGYWLPARN